MVQLLLAQGANPYTYDDTGYCAYDYLVDQAKPLELLAALLKTDMAFAQTQRSYQQVSSMVNQGHGIFIGCQHPQQLPPARIPMQGVTGRVQPGLIGHRQPSSAMLHY